MTSVLAIIANDARVNRRMIGLLVLLLPAVAFLGPMGGLSPMRTTAMLLALGGLVGPVLFPYWTVGLERATGTIHLLVGLPVSRFTIVISKTIGAVVLSAVLSAIGIACAAATHLAIGSDIAQLLVIAPALIIAGCTVSTAAYFLFPVRIATLAASGATALAAPAFHDWISSMLGATPAMLVLSYSVSIIVGCCSLYLTARIWARRPSPAD